MDRIYSSDITDYWQIGGSIVYNAARHDAERVATRLSK
jgi:hypothetical protein